LAGPSSRPFARGIALALVGAAERGEKLVAQQREVALDAALAADQHVVGVSHAVYGQEVAQQRAEATLHAVAHDRIADPLGDGDAIAQSRAAIGAGEQHEAGTGYAKAAIGGEKVRSPRQDRRLHRAAW